MNFWNYDNKVNNQLHHIWINYCKIWNSSSQENYLLSLPDIIIENIFNMIIIEKPLTFEGSNLIINESLNKIIKYALNLDQYE